MRISSFLVPVVLSAIASAPADCQYGTPEDAIVQAVLADMRETGGPSVDGPMFVDVRSFVHAAQKVGLPIADFSHAAGRLVRPARASEAQSCEWVPAELVDSIRTCTIKENGVHLQLDSLSRSDGTYRAVVTFLGNQTRRNTTALWLRRWWIALRKYGDWWVVSGMGVIATS